MCDCYNSRTICENHSLCKCERFKGKTLDVNNHHTKLIDTLIDGEMIDYIVVGFDHEKLSEFCCEWFNTCYLLFVSYDAVTELYCVKDDSDNLFYYDESYILASNTRFVTQACAPPCAEEDCFGCSAAECPHGEPLHRHHDGCPACFRDVILNAEQADEYRKTGNVSVMVGFIL